MQRDFEQRLEKVTQEAAIKGLATPKLLAADVLKEQKLQTVRKNVIPPMS